MKASPALLMQIGIDALNEELTRRETREGLCMVGLLHGEQVIIDYGMESCGGMAYVRLVTAVTTATFPNAATAGTCASDLAYSMEMGIHRPAVPFDGKNLPDADEQSAGTVLALDDMLAMHAALREVEARAENFVLGAYTPAGPAGGVLGGTWSFTVGEELDD